MTVLRSSISWTNSTWNTIVGCTPVSAGCDHCYAAVMVHRMQHNFGHAFSEVRLHPDRLAHVSRFRPIVGPDGLRAPHLVFTASMSDAWHEQIPDAFIHQTLDAMEANPSVIFQVLTKRPVRARAILTARYGNTGIPANIWIGVTAESNAVKARVDVLRSIQDRTGPMTAFLSVEPIVGPTDELDFTGMSWVITGGESGGGARIMQRSWLMASIDQARERGIALWHKQHGSMRSSPILHLAPATLGLKARFAWLVDHGHELLPGEKGGATLDGRATYRELPPHFHQLKAAMNPQPAFV